MKSCLALVLLLCCLLGPIMATLSIRRLLQPEIAECLFYHSVDLEDLLILNDEPINEIDPHVKCAVKCFLKKAGIVDDQGYLQLADIMGIYNDNIVKHYLYSHLSPCQGIQGNTTCDAASLTLLCIRQHIFS